jgi:hypothetical protein
MDCPLTKAVWMHLTTQLQQQELQQTPQRTISGWWKRLRRPFDKKQKPLVDGLYSLFLWNIWKERNRRIFQHVSSDIAEVASLIINNTPKLPIMTSPQAVVIIVFLLSCLCVAAFLMFLWSWVHSCL